MMDLITSRHGLEVLKPTNEDRIDSLPAELQNEFRRLKNEFTVDGSKLRGISRRFEEELQEGQQSCLPYCASLIGYRSRQIRL